MGCRLTVASRWRAVAATATGSAHRQRAEGGQDAVLVTSLHDGALVIAVADGAGSAPLAAEGSAAAVAAATAAIASGASMEDAFVLAAAALGDQPVERADRATTLLVGVLRDDCVDVGQVGDGFIVVRTERGYEVAIPAPEREYLNETTFLSSASWPDDFRAANLTGVDGVAVTTDGLQLVAIELATKLPFAGFFDPLFGWASTAGATDEELRAFLESPRLAERVDDDLTLALAVRDR